MSRYIDADALCKELKRRQNAAYNWSSESRAINDLEGEIRSDAALAMLSEVKLTIDAQPTANVRENVTGKWIKDNHFLKCPICEQTQYAVEAYDWEDGEWTCFLKYCPNCGAKLEDVDGEETK